MRPDSASAAVVVAAAVAATVAVHFPTQQVMSVVAPVATKEEAPKAPTGKLAQREKRIYTISTELGVLSVLKI